MSVQLINLVVLVAIINRVYSNTPEVQKNTKKEFRIAVVSSLADVSENLPFPKFFKGSLIYDSSSQEMELKIDSVEESESPPTESESPPTESESPPTESESPPTESESPPPDSIRNDKKKVNQDIILLGGSELTYFKGELYAGDDLSGRLYIYEKGHFERWTTVVTSADRNDAFAMPISWATARDNVMYVGPNGNDEVNVVAEVHGKNSETFIDFSDKFNALKKEAEMENGYMTHESCVYSAIHKEFYFLPKKASQTDYNDHADLTNAANILLTMSEDMTLFKKVANILHSTENKDRGYSSFAFLPDTKDEVIVALQTSDITDFTYITAFTRQGKVLLDSIPICTEQLKGLAFLSIQTSGGFPEEAKEATPPLKS